MGDVHCFLHMSHIINSSEPQIITIIITAQTALSRGFPHIDNGPQINSIKYIR